MPMAEINNTLNTMTQTTSVPRIRTLPKAYEEIKNLDSNTSFTMAALRSMCRSGEVKTFQVGNKTLLNFDSLLEALANQPTA